MSECTVQTDTLKDISQPATEINISRPIECPFTNITPLGCTKREEEYQRGKISDAKVDQLQILSSASSSIFLDSVPIAFYGAGLRLLTSNLGNIAKRTGLAVAL